MQQSDKLTQRTISDWKWCQEMENRKNLESVIVIENDYFNYACECECECVCV